MSRVALSELDLITRKLSVILNISEDDIDKVISFEKKSAREALDKYKSVEISGLCAISIRDYKVQSELRKRYNCLNKYTRDLESATEEKQIVKIQKKIDGVLADIEYLKTKQ